MDRHSHYSVIEGSGSARSLVGAMNRTVSKHPTWALHAVIHRKWKLQSQVHCRDILVNCYMVWEAFTICCNKTFVLLL